MSTKLTYYSDRDYVFLFLCDNCAHEVDLDAPYLPVSVMTAAVGRR